MVVLSSKVTEPKRSKSGASARSLPTTTCTAARKSASRNAANFGVKRCAIAWGVTTTPA